jgi:hypothetical protein
VVTSQPGQTFFIGYTTGTSSTYLQSISDWCRPAGYSGESQAVTLPYYDLYNHPVTGVNYIYGYVFPLDSTRTASSLTLPNNPDVRIIAATLGP